MAVINATYDNANTLKKITVGSEVYFVKDADLRKIVEGFHDAVYKDVSVELTEDGVALPTEGAVAKYVKEKVASLEGAMHFRGVITRTGDADDLTAIAAAVADPKSGDVVVMKDNSKEYIYNGTAWEELGDQTTHLTVATAAATYVAKTTTIAGIDLQDNITAEELEGPTALNLKALSHKDTASGTVEVFDKINDLTVARSGEYTLAGTTVAVPKTYSALDVTAAGTVTVDQTTDAAATYEKTSGVTIAATAADESHAANYTPAGKVALPALTASVELKTTDVATVTDAGTAYSMTDGKVEKAADATASFVQKGVKFSVNAEDESLSLDYTTAASDAAFYAAAVTAAGAVTYTAPKLSGALPTFGTSAVAVATGAVAKAAYNGEATFTGTGAVLGATVATETTAATVTQPVFAATFAGTKKSVTPTVATTEDAQAPNGTITVETTTVTPVVSKKTATVTVK